MAIAIAIPPNTGGPPLKTSRNLKMPQNYFLFCQNAIICLKNLDGQIHLRPNKKLYRKTSVKSNQLQEKTFDILYSTHTQENEFFRLLCFFGQQPGFLLQHPGGLPAGHLTRTGKKPLARVGRGSTRIGKKNSSGTACRGGNKIFIAYHLADFVPESGEKNAKKWDVGIFFCIR